MAATMKVRPLVPKKEDGKPWDKGVHVGTIDLGNLTLEEYNKLPFHISVKKTLRYLVGKKGPQAKRWLRSIAGYRVPAANIRKVELHIEQQEKDAKKAKRQAAAAKARAAKQAKKEKQLEQD